MSKEIHYCDKFSIVLGDWAIFMQNVKNVSCEVNYINQNLLIKYISAHLPFYNNLQHMNPGCEPQPHIRASIFPDGLRKNVMLCTDVEINPQGFKSPLPHH